MCTFPAEVEQNKALRPCFSSRAVNRRPICNLFNAMFSLFVLFVGDFAISNGLEA